MINDRVKITVTRIASYAHRIFHIYSVKFMDFTQFYCQRRDLFMKIHQTDGIKYL